MYWMEMIVLNGEEMHENTCLWNKHASWKSSSFITCILAGIRTNKLSNLKHISLWKLYLGMLTFKWNWICLIWSCKTLDIDRKQKKSQTEFLWIDCIF